MKTELLVYQCLPNHIFLCLVYLCSLNMLCSLVAYVRMYEYSTSSVPFFQLDDLIVNFDSQRAALSNLEKKQKKFDTVRSIILP